MPEDSVLEVRVTARQRITLGVGSEVGYFTGSHAFVPGSVLRGALAASWIAEHGPPDRAESDSAWFRELFDRQIRYGPLHPAGSGIVPVSAWLCKYPRDAACSAQAVDRAFEARECCPACYGPLEQGKGQVLLPAGTALERITRTSIDWRTAKAKDGELYAHAALPAGTTLHGYIHGRDPWLEQPRTLRLGGRRTVGGAAEYQALPTALPAPADPLTADGSLVIRLVAPAVFVDAAGRPRLDPDPGLDLDAAATGLTAWARPMTWAGWHAASRLPKPEELCAAAGSTYRIDGPHDALRGLAWRLQREGAGLRRAEGFGCIEIVTTPWRPGVPAAVTPPESAVITASLDWHLQVQDLGLDESERHWVTEALRELQLDRARHTGATAAARLADDLLARPAAARLSGRQRQKLGDLFAVTDPAVLREVTTLLVADWPGGEGTD